MAWTANQNAYAMYTIGTVESNCDWGGVYYTDPITIGMMQNYAYNACELLVYMRDNAKDSYAVLAASLRASVDAHPTPNNWWTGRFLTREEGNSWKASAKMESNHKAQLWKWVKDQTAYLETLGRWGVDTSRVKESIYWMSIYHQSPQACLQVIRAIGGGASLSRIHSAALSNRIVGKYVNRQNTVYSLLTKWDGTSAPPGNWGFVSDGQTGEGGDAGSGQQPTKDAGVSYVEQVGSQLIIHGDDPIGKLICYQCSATVWRPRHKHQDAGGHQDTGGSSGGSSSGSANGDFARMFQLWYDNAGKWRYGMGAGRLNPPASGYSDCSACIWWAVNKIRPDVGKRLGQWTGNWSGGGMIGTTDLVCEGVDVSKMKAGDLILMQHPYMHVDWYMGGGLVWGAGSAPLPHKVTDHLTSGFYRNRDGSRLKRIQVRRIRGM